MNYEYIIPAAIVVLVIIYDIVKRPQDLAAAVADIKTHISKQPAPTVTVNVPPQPQAPAPPSFVSGAGGGGGSGGPPAAPAAPPPAPTAPLPVAPPAPAVSAPVAPPAAPQPAAPAEKPFDPTKPDPTEFFEGVGRWMQVNGSNSISGPISPGHYTTEVGEGNQIEGSITIDNVVTKLWGTAFTVAKATSASLVATGNGTIQLQKLAAVAVPPPGGYKTLAALPGK